MVRQLIDVCLQLSEGFLALQGHPGLQIVHLELEPLKRAVGILSLTFVGNQHGSDGQQQEAAPYRQPHHGWQGQGTLGCDVQGAQPELQTTHQHHDRLPARLAGGVAEKLRVGDG